MGHSCVRAKVRRRKVAALAAYSRQFTVNNSTVTKTDLNKKNLVTLWKEINLTKYDTPIYGNTYEIDKDGHYHLIDLVCSWEHKRNKQPKRMIKCKMRKYSNWKSYAPQSEEVKKVKREKRNDFLKYFPNYPYTIKPMCKEAYMEKLTQHKLEKWERKHVKPEDMFTEEVEKWKQERFVAEQRLRDFVVSIYDKLPIMGNRVDAKNFKMKADKIAEVKDIDGKGHDVTHPNLSTEDKLYKEASKKAQEAMNKDETILDADLVNHKRNQKRPLNAKRAKTVTLADKKTKKAA